MTYFICASGDSLNQEDVNYIRGKGTVIVINNTFMLAKWADILYACDVMWWNAYREEAKEFKGRKISILHDQDGVEKWQYNGAKNGLGEDMIHSCGNSGYQAMNLAYLLGAKKIVLLGYDMQGTHWHGKHVRGLSNKHNFTQWINHFRVLSNALAKKGVEVINCSRQTALDCFKREDLENVC